MTARRFALPLAVLAALALQLVAAAPVRAVQLEWGTPSATSKFGTGVDFVQPLTIQGDVRRFEIAIDYPNSIGPTVSEVSAPDGGSLQFHLDTSQGQLVPNTPLTAQWRIVALDGSVAVGPQVHVTYADDRFSWRVKSGKHVTLHWYQGDETFADRAIAIGDAGIEKAASLFGADESKPVDFFVYADQNAFYDALGPGTPENVGGQAHPEIRTLFGLITPDEVNSAWVATVVPHELTHVVFDDVVDNPYHAPPHWLNEGVAVYLTVGVDASDRADISGAVQAGTLMPLDALTGRFPTIADRFFLAYSESVSAVDYLVRTYGRNALVKLVQTYARGVDDDTAFKAATGLSAADFDRAWMASNGVASPTRYGPQPAPTGPLPPGWASGGNVQPAASGGASGVPAAPTGAPEQGAATHQPGQEGGIPPVLILAALFVVVDLGVVAAILIVRRQSPRPPTPGGWF